jgi:tellurite resistance protein TehA-like permease
MAKIDEIKEYLTTLRVFFTVTIAIMVAIGGGIISSFRQEIYDVVFWIGVVSELILMVSVIFTIKKIKSKTREIKDL